MVTDCRLCRGIQGKSLMHISGKKIHLEAVYFCSEIKDKLAEKLFFFLRKESLWIVDVEYWACRNVRKRSRRMDI